MSKCSGQTCRPHWRRSCAQSFSTVCIAICICIPRLITLKDPPTHAYGVERREEGLTHPFVDDSISLEDKPAAFMNWVTAYDTQLPDELPRTISLDALRLRTPRGTPTIEKMSKDDVQKIFEPGVMLRSGALLATSEEIHARNTARALFDAADILPDVGVLALWCDSSPWVTVLAAKSLDCMRSQTPTDSNRRVRALSMVKINNANHMVSHICFRYAIRAA